MDIVRYTHTRQRLIDLYNDLSFGGVRMFVPPQMFMSKAELEARSQVSYEGSYAWGDPSTTHQPYLVTIPMLRNLIKGINKESNIGFCDADDSVNWFKKISEYLDLWMDIANECPQYYIPHLDELYELEEVALWIFHTYRPHMLTKIKMKQERDRAAGHAMDPNMNAFLVLFRMGVSESVDEIPEDMTFVSTLDERMPDRLSTYYNQRKKAQSTLSPEAEWKLDMADIAELIG